MVVLGPDHNEILEKDPIDQILKNFLWGTSKKFQADVVLCSSASYQPKKCHNIVEGYMM